MGSGQLLFDCGLNTHGLFRNNNSNLIDGVNSEAKVLNNAEQNYSGNVIQPVDSSRQPGLVSASEDLIASVTALQDTLTYFSGDVRSAERL